MSGIAGCGSCGGGHSYVPPSNNSSPAPASAAPAKAAPATPAAPPPGLGGSVDLSV